MALRRPPLAAPCPSLLTLLLLVMLLLSNHITSPLAAAPASTWAARPFALVDPLPGTSRLQVAQEGLKFLESLSDKPVAPVVVIGPYRSGKSFLLNQLLGVPCSELFLADRGWCWLFRVSQAQQLQTAVSSSCQHRLSLPHSSCSRVLCPVFCRCGVWCWPHAGDRDQGHLGVGPADACQGCLRGAHGG